MRTHRANPKNKGPIGQLAGLLALVSAAWMGCDHGSPAAPSRIILIVVDTLRRDHVSAYGSGAATPNIDGLAERGQVFTNAVSSFHQTTMSTAALLTGRTPSLETGRRGRPLMVWGGRGSCGLARFAASGGGDSCVPRGVTTLAEALRSAGYWTLGIVSSRLLFKPYGYDQGFDEWVQVGARQRRKRKRELAELRAAEHVNRAAIEALRRRPNDRFFLYLHYVDVHDWNLRGRAYAEAVTEFDRALAEILGFLDGERLLDDSLVVLTSDHGEQLGETHALPYLGGHRGNPSYEPVLQVPLIVAPAVPDDATRLIRSEDVAALIKRVAGLTDEVPPDLLPDELFLTESFYQTYRRGRWKSTWPRKGKKIYLFDLLEDPTETRDVAKAHPKIVVKHRRRIRTLTRRLAAPTAERAELTDDDRERLRALGYLREARPDPPLRSGP